MKDNTDCLQIKFHGVKCDNPECGWKDDSVKMEDYYKYVDTPCPCCGENLMTRKCYENVQMQLRIAEQVNKAFHMLPKFVQDQCLEKAWINGKYNVDKDGFIISNKNNSDEYER